MIPGGVVLSKTHVCTGICAPITHVALGTKPGCSDNSCIFRRI